MVVVVVGGGGWWWVGGVRVNLCGVSVGCAYGRVGVVSGAEWITCACGVGARAWLYRYRCALCCVHRHSQVLTSSIIIYRESTTSSELGYLLQN